MEVPRRRRERNVAAADTADYFATSVTGILARLGDPALEFAAVGC